MNYKTLNNIVGWFVFLIAAFTYISTVEPTASLWDCSEFITSAYKLEVGHPPGAPLFMMVGHLFTLFVSPGQVGFMLNVYSALCSAFTILFLFWSITILVRKVVNKSKDQLTVAEKIMIMGSGVVGALAYTFTDTFWFSAVEGEVYAASSLITAIVFWAILKWEEQADEKYANRWLILICYVTGLSIGVHLLNLLVVPAIVFVYYFKKYKVTRKGVILTAILSFVILTFLVFGMIPYTPVIASWFELLFVNSFGLPINSGLVFFVLVLAAALAYSIYYTHKKGKVVMNTIMLGLSLCMLGFGSYAMIVIRSSANPPMDQNNPDNIFALIKYINRDQYGSRPIVTGPYYNNTSATPVYENKYIKLGDRYVKEDLSVKYKYNQTTIFPRMYSDREDHIQIYKTYVKGTNPTFGDNLHFFFDYQLGFMYWRYFMWNFAGKQNDMQASIYDLTKGNWVSGVKFMDEGRLGNMDDMPQYLATNKGNNKYYFLPLILGLLGLFYHLKKDKKGFTIVLMLFFFTGLAIILYLNQPPNEPRERDYTYAGSFYAFAIWIGFGVTFIYSLLQKIVNPKIAATLAVILGLPVPAILAQQNWDDHNRSGRYIATDFGYNYLSSAEDESVIYTFGDNDTFPLWYNQEVEGVRTDVKVANTMYLQSDWYYIQMMRRSYDAPPLRTSATPASIIGETRGILPVIEQRPNLEIKYTMDLVMDDKNKRMMNHGSESNYFPTKALRLYVDKEKAINAGMVMDTAAMVPYLQFNLPERGVLKNRMAILDFAANNFYTRPIYYGFGDPDYYMGIEGNLRREGLLQRLVPEDARRNPIDVEKTYDLLMNTYRYRGINDPNVYMDETARRTTGHYRNAFFAMADYLWSAGDTIRLRNLMLKFKEVLPEMVIVNAIHTPYIAYTNPVVKHYLRAGLTDEAVSLSQRLIDDYRREFNYYFRLSAKMPVDYELSRSYQGIRGLYDMLGQYKQGELENLHKQADEVLKDIEKTLMSPVPGRN